MEEINKLTERIIGCAIEVHRQPGPGLLEGTYEAALAIKLEIAGLHFDRQIIFPVVYKNKTIGEYRVDLSCGTLCDRRNQKCGEVRPRVKLLINFNSRLVHDGIKRFIR